MFIPSEVEFVLYIFVNLHLLIQLTLQLIQGDYIQMRIPNFVEPHFFNAIFNYLKLFPKIRLELNKILHAGILMLFVELPS